MTQRKPTSTYTAEFRERGLRLFNESRRNYSSDNAAYKAIGSKLGCSPDSLNSKDKARLKALESENRKLRQANEIRKKASAYFAQAEFDRPFKR